ncbi:MAG TPA: hypothetical protein ENF90_00695 [Candidatus Bathyarchaeota archaeon]|nr:hypothetical protein [Candidatus Bathyarchaeota archaeon]
MIKPGDWIVCRIRKITYGQDGKVYVTLEVPGIEYPNINYPSFVLEPSELEKFEELAKTEVDFSNCDVE